MAATIDIDRLIEICFTAHAGMLPVLCALYTAFPVWGEAVSPVCPYTVLFSYS